MISIKLRFFTLATVAAIFTGGSAMATGTVDTIYTNGNIYTVNQSQPWATAFAVNDGNFIKVGSDSEVTALADKTTKCPSCAGYDV